MSTRGRRFQAIFASEAAAIAAIVATLALSFVLDVYVLSGASVLIAYALPLVIASLYTNPVIVRTTAIVAVALSVGSDLFGLSPGGFDLLNSVAAIIGAVLAVRVAEQRFAAKESNQEISALLSVTNEITASLDLPTTLDHILDAVVRLTDCSAGIAFVDSTGTRLTYEASRGPRAPVIHGLTFPIGQGVTGKVAESGIVANVPDVSVEPRWFWPPGFNREDIRSALFVPLTTIDGRLGVLIAYSPYLAPTSRRHMNGFSAGWATRQLSRFGALETWPVGTVPTPKISSKRRSFTTCATASS